MARRTRPHAAVVFNPTKVSRGELEAAVTEHARAAGFADTHWFETSADDAGAGAAREAIDTGAAVIMAAGGDGTVRSVAHALRGTDVPLTLLPTGTGNILARNLGLAKLSLPEAVELAFTGNDRAIDVGVVQVRRQNGGADEHSFLVACGLGLDAATMQETNPEAKKRIGWLAYVGGAVRAGWRSKRKSARISVDGGRTVRAQLHTVIVANCGQFPPNIVLMPEAAIDDGRLDMVYAGPRTWIGWIQLSLRVTIDNRIIHRQHRTAKRVSWRAWKSASYEFVQGATITVAVDGHMPCEIDGDVFGDATALRCTVDPHSLVVKVIEPTEPAEPLESDAATAAADSAAPGVPTATGIASPVAD